ncbi:MAG: radical SAM protein, partial [Planctomycetes bacterium]|nr:radical SAM protein [Planctomycetota bacterium]
MALRDSAEALTDLPLDAFPDIAVEMGFRSFHGKILRRWIFQLGARDYESITDLPRAFREELALRWPLHRLQQALVQKSSDGTEKVFYRLPDGHGIETVSIPDGERRTLCVSTQVGCSIGCLFCASGRKGLARNLKAGEIIEQVLLTKGNLQSPLTNIVFMGIGEPLMNLDQLSTAIRIINHPEGIGLGARRITVST